MAKKILSLEQQTDKLVKKYKFDHNEHHYGGLDHVEDDDELCDAREVLMDFIEMGKSEDFINKFHLLLEVERQLTLREDQ